MASNQKKLPTPDERAKNINYILVELANTSDPKLNENSSRMHTCFTDNYALETTKMKDGFSNVDIKAFVKLMTLKHIEEVNSETVGPVTYLFKNIVAKNQDYISLINNSGKDIYTDCVNYVIGQVKHPYTVDAENAARESVFALGILMFDSHFLSEKQLSSEYLIRKWIAAVTLKYAKVGDDVHKFMLATYDEVLKNKISNKSKPASKGGKKKEVASEEAVKPDSNTTSEEVAELLEGI